MLIMVWLGLESSYPASMIGWNEVLLAQHNVPLLQQTAAYDDNAMTTSIFLRSPFGSSLRIISEDSCLL